MSEADPRPQEEEVTESCICRSLYHRVLLGCVLCSAGEMASAIGKQPPRPEEKQTGV